MNGIRASLLGVLLVAVAALAVPGAAHAQSRGGAWGGGWHGGWGGGWGWRGGCCWGGGFIGVAPVPVFPGPFWGPPVVIAPPTVVVTPAPAIAGQVPAAGGPPPPAGACYAAQWVCPLPRMTPVGNSCSCPVGGGVVWGRAN